MSITPRTIYAQLGNLFYSIAAREKSRSLDINQLKVLISKDWVPRSWSDALFISDQAHFILTKIDALAENKTAAHEAYMTFSKFYSLHSELFPLETKNLIDKTSEEIVELFSEDDIGVNPYLRSARKLLYANRMPVY